MTEDQELFDTKDAAAWLASKTTTKTEQQWFYWLGSNRNPNRQASWRFPFLKLGAQVFYLGDDLRKLSRIQNATAQRVAPAPEDAAWLKSLATKKPTAE